MQQAIQFPALLAAAGVQVDVVGGWETRTAGGDFAPVGIVVHHTAGTNSLGQIVAGNLAQLHLAKSGRVTVVSARKSSHAGIGLQRVLDRTRAGLAPLGDARDVYGLLAGRGSISGNPHYVGVEVENLGDGRDPYPTVQLDALVRTCAAILQHLGRPAGCVIHHREWTSRKVDMSWRGPLRERVAALLASTLEPGAASVPVPVPRKDDEMAFTATDSQNVTWLFAGVWRRRISWEQANALAELAEKVPYNGPIPDVARDAYKPVD